jgi:hypothetical protein
VEQRPGPAGEQHQRSVAAGLDPQDPQRVLKVGVVRTAAVDQLGQLDPSGQLFAVRYEGNAMPAMLPGRDTTIRA